MHEGEVLQALHSGELSVDDAYAKLYPPVAKAAQPVNMKNLKRAHFIRMRIYLPEESAGLNLFLKTLFILPVPIRLVNFALRFVKIPQKYGSDFSVDEIKALLKYSKGTRINVVTDDAIVKIAID